MEEKKVKIKFNIIAIICILIFCITISPKTLQNDTFYTIKNGEQIIKNKGINMEEPFAWHEGLKYTYPHWMYDTGIYLVYHAGENVATHLGMDAEQGGMIAIYISTIVLASVLGILIYRTNIKINKSYIISFFLTLGVLYLLRNFIAARAQLLSYIFFTLEILFIEQFLKTKKKRYAIGLFTLAILIANCHAAVWYLFFILALPYIGEAFIIKLIDSNWSYKVEIKSLQHKLKVIERKLDKCKEDKKKDRLKNKIEDLKNQIKKTEEMMIKNTAAKEKMEKNAYKIKTERRENIKWLILVLIICMFSGLLTPQPTFEPYTHSIKLMVGNAVGSISEHQPIVLINSIEALFIGILILAFLIFTDTKITYKDLFMLGGLIVLTLISQRQLSILGLIGIYSLTRLMLDFMKKYESENADMIIMRKLTKIYPATVIILLSILCGVNLYGNKNEHKYISEKNYPVQAAQYILDNIDIENMRLYNHYNFGSYLLYRNIPVFIDSRCDLYTPEFNEKNIFSDTLAINALNTDYDEKFEEYGITHIITESDSKLTMVLNKGEDYNKIYEDEYFCIFERKAK